MSLAPVEYVIIEFPGEEIGEEVAPALAALGTAARTAVISGTATATSNRVAASQQRGAPPQAAAVPPPASSAAATTPSVTDELIEQLRKLGELRDAGILSEEEFAAKKAQLLGI